MNVFAWPYIPILAVGGGGKVIEIYQIFSHPHDHDVMDVLHETSITGHGAVRFSSLLLKNDFLTFSFDRQSTTSNSLSLILIYFPQQVMMVLSDYGHLKSLLDLIPL